MITSPEMITSMELENAYTSGVYSKRPVNIVRGEGALLWDADGREYIDCAAGHGVANIGHGRTEIAGALALQAQRLITCPEIVYNDVRARLLERLAQITPDGLSRFFLCNSGTEAVEGALKFARLATGRTGIVATLRSFHGRTMGALSATWEPHYREPFAPLVPGVTHIRYNDSAAAENAITHETAAVLLELVQGEGGVYIAKQEYVRRIADICHERGALLIIDEVQTGFGRTGRLFACEHYDLTPDILCLAKSMAGGVPMGAICLGSLVIESGRINSGVHGSTFGGNPLACAAALETLAIFERENLPTRAAESGAYLLDRLRSLHLPLIREVRGLGLMIGIELRTRVQPYLEVLLERGILALPAGPNVIRLLPPLVITHTQIDHVVDAIADAVGTASARPRTPSNPSPQLTDMEQRRGQVTENNSDDEIALLRNMLTIPSYSRQEGALAHYLVEQAQRMGLDAYIDDVGNMIAQLPISSEAPIPWRPQGSPLPYSSHERRPVYGTGGPCGRPGVDDRSGNNNPITSLAPIILLGHMDTVTGVIPVRLEDDLLYGRGAVDAKGPLAAFLCAVARIARGDADVGGTEGAINRAPTVPGVARRPIVVVGAVEEEVATSRGAHALVERYQPSACIIGEPSGSRALTIGYKGRLLVEGYVERASSHSAGPRQSSSEVATAFWERVHRHAAEWNEQHAGNSAFAALMPSLRNINSEQNGLIERTRFVIGYRLPPNFAVLALREQLQNWARADDVQLSFSGEEAAFQSNRATPLARAFIGAIRATGGQATFKHKTGTSDMNVVGPAWGQNIVAYGPGDSSLDHTPNEHIRIDEYLHSIDVLEHVLQAITQQQEGLPIHSGNEAIASSFAQPECKEGLPIHSGNEAIASSFAQPECKEGI